METKKLWRLPVPSTAIEGTKLIYPGGDACLLFEYYDEIDQKFYHSGILFDAVQAHKHTTEAFTSSIMGAYDTLVEIVDSEWIAKLQKINRQAAALWRIRHYVLFLKSAGLFEFIARNYRIMETKEGVFDESK